MFGALTVGYLFLGGSGAGAILVACVLDLALVRAPFGADAHVSVGEAPPQERVAAFTLLAGLALSSGHPSATASAARLVGGSGALAWWGGFAACGLAAPLVVELAFAVRDRAGAAGRPTMRAALAVVAVLVLVGGFSLRGAIVEAGAHRALELEEPSGLNASAHEDAAEGPALADDGTKPSA